MENLDDQPDHQHPQAGVPTPVVSASRSPQTFHVHTTRPDGTVLDGSLTIWPNSTAVYVSQPQRPRVVDGTDHFCAISRPHGATTPVKFDDLVTAAQFDDALAILAAFDNDPLAAEHTAQARRHLASESLENLTRYAARVEEKLAALHQLKADLATLREDLERSVEDAGPIPTLDDLHLRAMSRI